MGAITAMECVDPSAAFPLCTLIASCFGRATGVREGENDLRRPVKAAGVTKANWRRLNACAKKITYTEIIMLIQFK